MLQRAAGCRLTHDGPALGEPLPNASESFTLLLRSTHGKYPQPEAGTGASEESPLAVLLSPP